MRNAVRVAIGVAILGVVVLSVGAAGQTARPWPSAPTDPTVTPVAGPGWLTRLGVTLSQTSLGRGPGRYGPAEKSAATPAAGLGVPAQAALTGADLYRFNCQACHGLEGRGAPPEIKSAVDPVRGVPLEVLREQMKAQHQPPGEAEARARPERVRAGILARVHNGGQRMPSRAHLSPGELDLLFAYLGVLAASPSAAPAKRETVSWARVGQHVVKGTCHICHDATGARPSDTAMVQGKIPSLQSLLVTQSVAEFVTKARSGAPVQLSGLAMMHRGRMPVFYYLTDQEIASAYVYLATYPPK